MPKENKTFPFHVPIVLYENRYCNQKGFSILIREGKYKNEKVENEVLELELPSFEIKKFPSTVKPHYIYNLATINSDIIAVCGKVKPNDSLESAVSVEIYSEKTKTWSHQYVQIDERKRYCVSSFMSKLYLIGGWIDCNNESLISCYSYDINSNAWNQIADL